MYQKSSIFCMIYRSELFWVTDNYRRGIIIFTVDFPLMLIVNIF